METKTPGYPREIFVGKGLLPGGNWVGKSALLDGSPLGTFRREIWEELSFGNPSINSDEMNSLFGTGHLGHEPKPRNITATPKDEEALKKVVSAIKKLTTPFAAFLQKIDRVVFDMGNPKNEAGHYKGLVSVFSVHLPDDIWFLLVDLQEKYGNLSNESQSLITSFWEIKRRGIQLGWGHDQILETFFFEELFNRFETTSPSGTPENEEISLMPYTEVGRQVFCDKYEKYLKNFEPAKVPDGIKLPSSTSS